jgi:methyl-accepting chemotaxis protein
MALTTFGGHSRSQNLPKGHEDDIWQQLIIAALKVEQSNVEAITVAKTMAIAQETGLFGKRKESSRYAKKILEEYPQFTGSYFAYEPNADQDDKAYLRQVGTEKGEVDAHGRFLPYWFRDLKDPRTIHLTPLLDMETSLYYQGVKDKFLSGSQEKYLVTEPYVYEEKMIIEQVYPVVIEGKFVGIAGVDRALTDLRAFLQALKPYTTADLILLSRLGQVIAATLDPGLQTKPITETPYKDILNAFYQNKTDRPNVGLLTDPVDGKKYFYGGVPIKPGDWTLVMRVSEEEMLSRQK